MKWLAAIFSVILGACNPTQHNEQRYGVVTIGFGAPIDTAGPWRSDQLVELRNELQELNALGPTFTEVTEATAQIVVRPFDSSMRSGTCHLAAACYGQGNTYVEVDPAETAGYLELRTAMAHEIGHALGMHHVCFTAGEASDCDTAVGVGPAIMNPQISYGDVLDPNAVPGDPTGVPTTDPTDLDLAEFRRTHP